MNFTDDILQRLRIICLYVEIEYASACNIAMTKSRCLGKDFWSFTNFNSATFNVLKSCTDDCSTSISGVHDFSVLFPKFFIFVMIFSGAAAFSQYHATFPDGDNIAIRNFDTSQFTCNT